MACARDKGWAVWEPCPDPVAPTGALEIGQALPVHAGLYTCTARNTAGVAHKHMVLTVQGKGPARPGGRGAVGLGRERPGCSAPAPRGGPWERRPGP